MLALAFILSGVLLADRPQVAASPPPSAVPGDNAYQVAIRFTPLAPQHKPAPYELADNHLVFKAVVAGREVWALLDTGAQRSLIDTTLATSVGLPIASPQGSLRTSTGALIPKRRVDNVDISVPDQVEIQRAVVGAMDMAALSAIVGRKIEFVLGADFLSKVAVKIDPAKRTLDIYPSGALRPPQGFPYVPLREGFKIDVLVEEKPVLVEVDLGASGALMLEPEAWARVAPANARVVPGRSVGADGQGRAFDVGVLPAMSLGANRYTNVRTQIRPWSGDDTEGAVGMGVLRDLFIVLDVQAGKMWLAPQAAPRGSGGPSPSQ